MARKTPITSDFKNHTRRRLCNFRLNDGLGSETMVIDFDNLEARLFQQSGPLCFSSCFMISGGKSQNLKDKFKKCHLRTFHTRHHRHHCNVRRGTGLLGLIGIKDDFMEKQLAEAFLHSCFLITENLLAICVRPIMKDEMSIEED